jgi:murein endopeptidase
MLARLSAAETSSLRICPLVVSVLAACAPTATINALPIPKIAAPFSAANVAPIAELVDVAEVAPVETTTAACEVADESGEESGEIPEEPDATGVDPGLRYTAEISDEALALRFKDDLESLGSISIGLSNEGRLINAQQFPPGDGTAWTVIMPGAAWATKETIDYVTAAAERVKSLQPHVPPLRVNGISLKEGGWFRPHRTHQNGRDVDLGFYYSTAEAPRCRACEKLIDVPANWELVRALVTLSDVQVILVDRNVQKVLYDYAVSIGEDRGWLDSLFNAGEDAIVKHARRHRDHFHVRFFNPRAQELGRRVAPLLAQRPDQNLVMVRVRNGDNLGKIALRNKSSIRAIQKANRMRGTFLRAGQVLRVPMRGPCTKCPIPPPVDIPARRLPPQPVAVNP